MTSTHMTLTLVPSKQDSFQRQFHSPGQSPSRCLAHCSLNSFPSGAIQTSGTQTLILSVACFRHFAKSSCQVWSWIAPGCERAILSMKALHCVPGALPVCSPIQNSHFFLSVSFVSGSGLMSLHGVLCSEEQKASVPAGVAEAAH